MIYNILNGDSLAHSFPDTKIEGGIIVVREALIDGDLSGDNLPEFWQSRVEYIGLTEVEYQTRVVNEFEKIINAPANTEFNLGLSMICSARLICGLLFQSSIVCQ